MLLSCSINAGIEKIPVQLRWSQGFVWTGFLDHAAFLQLGKGISDQDPAEDNRSMESQSFVTFVQEIGVLCWLSLTIFGSTVPLVADMSADTFLSITKAAPTSLGVCSFNS